MRTQEEALDRICLSLQENNPRLTTLYCSSMMFGQNFAARVRECMRHNTHVCKLELANLESREAETLAEVIAESNLTTIESLQQPFRSRFETLDTRRRANQILCDGIRRSRSIQEIALHAVPNEELDDFSEILVNVPSISTFILSENLGRLASTVLANSFLTTLEVHSVKLGDDDLASLAQGLGQTRLLKCLVLNCCYLDDAKLGRLIEQWPRDSPLETLRVPSNDIGPVGATLLLRAVADHPNMRVLDLQSCYQIRYEGLRLIGEALSVRQHPLTELDISSCARCEMDPSCDIKAEARKQAGRALLEGITNNHHITKMVVNRPHRPHVETFPLNVIEQIDFKTTLNRMGRHNMVLNEHSLPSSVWSFIFFKCQREPRFGASLLYFVLCEHPTLLLLSRTPKRKFDDIEPSVIASLE